MQWGGKGDAAIDAVVVTGLTSMSVATFNGYLASIGLIIAIPIAVLRLCILWREWRKK